MYKIVLLLLSVLFVNHLQAQGTLTPSLADTLLLKQVYENDQISYLAETKEPFTGVVVDYHENGSLKLRKSVVKGKAEGLWIEWYDTGVVRYLGEWKDGKGHGTWMYFYENGELSERSQVMEDMWHGISESWHKNGKKAAEGLLANNQRVGEWKLWNQDGSLKEIKNYSEEN